jgi:hypothetical protein
VRRRSFPGFLVTDRYEEATSGGEAGGLGARAERREVKPRRGAEAGDDLPLVARAGQERFPADEMLDPVEVAGRDGRQLRLGHPAVDLMPVDQLEAVDEAAECFELPPTGHDEQPVPLARPLGLALDLRDVLAEPGGRDAEVRPRVGSFGGCTWSVMQRTSNPCPP